MSGILELNLMRAGGKKALLRRVDISIIDIDPLNFLTIRDRGLFIFKRGVP